VDNSKKPQEIKEKNQTWSALSLAWQLGYSIAIPLVVLALGGRLLDKKFGTSPWLLLSGVILSLFISTFLVYSRTIKILSETEKEQKDKKE
jgi:F0F1-type ATP synthase assembly protein I